MPGKRFSKRALLLPIGLGLATNLGVAWSLSALASGRRQPVRSELVLGSEPWSTILVSSRRWGFVQYHEYWRVRDRPTWLPAASEPPGWVAREIRRSPPPPGDPYAMQMDEPEVLVSAGWPLQSFRCRAKTRFAVDMAANPSFSHWPGPGVDHVREGGASLPSLQRPVRDVQPLMQPSGLRFPMPVHPMWPGILVNSVAYTCAWATILGVPLSLRRLMRKREGFCQKCGYNRVGLGVCPECGSA